MADETEWLRARGLGRERFAGYIADFLGSLGYAVEREERTEPAESRLLARLARMNPAVPTIGRELEVRLIPTSGGSAAFWVRPLEVPPEERERLDRLVREIVAHLERAVSTESHAAAKITRPPNARLPWNPPPP